MAARDDAGEAFAGGEPQVGEPRLEIWVDPDLKGHLAWTFDMDAGSLTQPDARRYWVAAVGEPTVLNWESRIFHGHHGLVSGTLWTESALGATANQGLQDLEVVRAGAGRRDDARPPPTGATASSAGPGPAESHRHAARPAFGGREPGRPGPRGDQERRTGQSDRSELRRVRRVHAGAGLGVPVDERRLRHRRARSSTRRATSSTSARIPTRVNIADSCNAFYHPSFVTINFFQAGGGCPNTAYSDVVLHEYGHAVDHAKGDILDGGYSEGFGDALALIGTRQSCLGRDFFGAGTCLRPATDLIMWPPAPGDGVHTIGRRYAGFTWELIEQLKNTFDDDGAFGIAERLVLGAAAASPSDIPDAVHLMFLVDDDDGNLANGTPHFEALAAAADSRNIPRPPIPRSAARRAWSPLRRTSPSCRARRSRPTATSCEASFTLTEPTEVHITASSSASVPAERAAADLHRLLQRRVAQRHVDLLAAGDQPAAGRRVEQLQQRHLHPAAGREPHDLLEAVDGRHRRAELGHADGRGLGGGGAPLAVSSVGTTEADKLSAERGARRFPSS